MKGRESLMKSAQPETGETLETPGTNFVALGAIIARHGHQNVSTELKYVYLRSGVEAGRLTKKRADEIAEEWGLDLWSLSRL